MITLSASRIKLYKTCRYQYYDKYIRGVPDVANTSALMGSALHSAIEQYYRKGKNPRIAFDAYFIRMYNWWSTSGAEFKRYEEFSTLLQTGRTIVESFPFDHYAPILLEHKFIVPFDNICFITGFIDSVCRDSSIVDYKSSKRKPTQSTLDNDPQFILYSYAYYTMNNTWPQRVLWHHLRDHSVMDFSLTNIERRVTALQELCKIIVADTFEDVATTSRCANCSAWCERKQ